jgi:hypothetical protein
MEYVIVSILDIVVQPIKIFFKYVGIIMDIKVPILIIDQRCILIMSTDSQTRRITHLTLNIVRVE